ncbi:MAG: response regulator [Solirubrobacteraceae bacterium]
MEVVGEAPNGREAVRLAHGEQPDIVLMDIRMPEMDGIEATQQITNGDDRRAVKIIILTTFETEDLVVSALRAGASGYLGKGVEPANLLAAVRTVAAGESLLSPSATRALISRMLAQPNFEPVAATPLLDELTPREREVLLLVARGLTNTEIAERLFITPGTAKTHVNRTMVKLHAHDRAQLVITAYESGLLQPGRRVED